MPYFVYMLLCTDGSYYTGVAVDVKKRFTKHVSGKGANYTRSHPPVKIVYTEKLPDKGSALHREHELKRLAHAEKAALIAAST